MQLAEITKRPHFFDRDAGRLITLEINESNFIFFSVKSNSIFSSPNVLKF